MKEMRTFYAANDLTIPKGKKGSLKELKKSVESKYGELFQPLRAARQAIRKEHIDRHDVVKAKYYVVLDFECTCWEDEPSKIELPNKEIVPNPNKRTQEIIEFPAVLVDVEKNTIVDTFQEYVKPVLHPKLSEFCTSLTGKHSVQSFQKYNAFSGITQTKVDNGKPFPEVLKLFLNWLKKHGLTNLSEYLIITDGRTDIKEFLNGTLIIHNIPFPHQLRTFTDLKFVFRKLHTGSSKLVDMLQFYKIKFEGQQHCGLDDAKNIAKLAMKMASGKRKMMPTHRMIPPKFIEFVS